LEIFRNKQLQNELQHTVIVFHDRNQIAFEGKNNKQNQILQLLIYHLRRLNNKLFIFHGSIQIIPEGKGFFLFRVSAIKSDPIEPKNSSN